MKRDGGSPLADEREEAGVGREVGGGEREKILNAEWYHHDLHRFAEKGR